MILELYGKLYAPINAPYLDNCPTIHGTYRKRTYGVILCDRDGAERAFIRRDGMGPVSLFTDGTGRRHYMFAANEADKAWLGVPASITAENDGARDLACLVYQEETA